MIYLIERHIVEHIQVLVGISAVDIHTGQALCAVGNAGLQLQSFYHVTFAEQCRGMADFLGCHFLGADFRGLHSRSLKARHYEELVELGALRRG